MTLEGHPSWPSSAMWPSMPLTLPKEAWVVWRVFSGQLAFDTMSLDASGVAAIEQDWPCPRPGVR